MVRNVSGSYAIISDVLNCPKIPSHHIYFQSNIRTFFHLSMFILMRCPYSGSYPVITTLTASLSLGPDHNILCTDDQYAMPVLWLREAYPRSWPHSQAAQEPIDRRVLSFHSGQA